MVFSSTLFLFLFLPLVLGGYHLLPWRARNTFLLIASLGFYAWGEGLLVLLLIASVMLNYAFGRALGRTEDPTRRRRLLWGAVAANLIPLAWFKYTNFLVANLSTLSETLGMGPLSDPGIHLPIGISFFTFQALSYVIDLYRGEVEVQESPADLLLYVSLFPQLIAGPIVRYHDVAQELQERRVTLADMASGIERFVGGLAKKVLLANAFAVPADAIFALPAAELTAKMAWFGTACYGLQIYFDFSGYSCMAIGLGRMFGFHFLENFRHPYVARSIQDFWRRWHISLSSWFRDYLYIPLGGSRAGSWQTSRNLWTVFLVCGLWHGAAWPFVIWGAYHGLFLVLERGPLGRLLKRVPRPLQHFYTIVVVLVGWVFFRAETLTQATDMIATMFGAGGPGNRALKPSQYMDKQFRILMWAALIGCTPIIPWLAELRDRLGARAGALATAGCFAIDLGATLGVPLLYLLSAITLASASHNPFIYFRF